MATACNVGNSNDNNGNSNDNNGNSSNIGNSNEYKV
jgi:hypothetical protein